MKRSNRYGRCPRCGEFSNVEHHRCPPRWLAKYAEDDEGDEVEVWAETARDAAAEFVERDQAANSDYAEGETEVVVAVADDPRDRATFVVSAQASMEYSAWQKEDDGGESGGDGA